MRLGIQPVTVLKDQIQHLVELHLLVAGTADAMDNQEVGVVQEVEVDEIMALTVMGLRDKASVEVL